MSLPPSFYDHFEDRLNLIRTDINMGLREIKQALRGHPDRGNVALDGDPRVNATLEIGGREIEIGRRDTAADIRAKLNPAPEPLMPEKPEPFMAPLAFAPIEQITERPKVSMLKTQGVSAKLAKLKHDLEYDAGKLSDRIDSVAGRKDAAFAKGHQFLDTTEGHIGEVEQFVKDLEDATGNGPPV